MAPRKDLLLTLKAKAYSREDNCLSLNEMKSEITAGQQHELQGPSMPGSRRMSETKLQMGKAGGGGCHGIGSCFKAGRSRSASHIAKAF